MTEHVRARILERVSTLVVHARDEVQRMLDEVPEIAANDFPTELRLAINISAVVGQRHAILTRTDVQDGVRYWRSNGAPVPTWAYEDAHMLASAAQRLAHSKHQEEGLAAYVKTNKGRKLTDEERFEMRVAFGPGEKVVDIFTGDKHTT